MNKLIKQTKFEYVISNIIHHSLSRADLTGIPELATNIIFKFRWLLSNVVDTKGEQLVSTIRSKVIDWNGVKVGLMGLVEEEWLVTLNIDVTQLKYTGIL